MGLAALGIGPGDEVVLADTNWKWVAASDSTSVKFTHSIFGIITVCMTIVQVGFIFF